jgi:CRISPR/Cas system-associated protein Csm6
VFATDVFGTTDATWTLRVENGDRAVDIAATWLSFSVQSAGSINERLLIDSETRFGQVVGSIPAAPLREVGVARAAVFGLFGAVEREDVFSYTLPDAVKRVSKTLFTRKP